jgi:hypothetical protein
VPYTPHTLKWALLNTARVIKGVDKFALGAGLIQVEAAYEHAIKYGAELARLKVRYEVDLPTLKYICVVSFGLQPIVAFILGMVVAVFICVILKKAGDPLKPQYE